MFENQKSQEISLALIKISVYVRRKELRQRLERFAFQLIEDAANRNFEELLAATDVLGGLVKFGKLIYEIEPINANTLLQELNYFNSEIRQRMGFGIEKKEEIHKAFARVPAIKDDGHLYHSATEGHVYRQAGESAENGNGHHDNGNGNGISGTIRQSAIIEKIRQSSNTAMKDLIAVFPEVSERTLRYDLQKLCNQGVIERIGNGGPSSYYISSNKAVADSL